jgi:hypothetical protein
MPQPSSSGAVMRNGLTFGAILGVLGIGISFLHWFTGAYGPTTPTSASFAAALINETGALAILDCVTFLVMLAFTFTAGALTAGQTGRISSGAFAGLVAGAVGALLGGVTDVIVVFLLAVPAIQATVDNGDGWKQGQIQGLLIGVVVGGLVGGLLVNGGIGAGMGALGGLLGASDYRKANPPAYQSTFYPSVPFPYPVGVEAMAPQPAASKWVLLYGLISGAILAVAGVGNSVMWWFITGYGVTGPVLGCGASLVMLAFTFVPGMGAARRTGRVSIGAFAGSIAGLLAGAGSALLVSSVIVVLIIPWLSAMYASIFAWLVAPGADLALFLLFLAMAWLVVAINVLLLSAGVGAGIGALGGLVGRNSYKKANSPHSHQPAFYPSARGGLERIIPLRNILAQHIRRCPMPLCCYTRVRNILRSTPFKQVTHWLHDSHNHSSHTTASRARCRLAW